MNVILSSLGPDPFNAQVFKTGVSSLKEHAEKLKSHEIKSWRMVMNVVKSDGRTEGRTDGQTDRQTDRQSN